MTSILSYSPGNVNCQRGIGTISSFFVDYHAYISISLNASLSAKYSREIMFLESLDTQKPGVSHCNEGVNVGIGQPMSMPLKVKKGRSVEI
jgi:hypothetical protein